MRRTAWALATPGVFAAVAMTMTLAMASAQQSKPPLSIRVPVPPTPVLTDGTWRLLYELHIENRGDSAIALTSLEIRADSTTRPAAIALDGERLVQLLDTPADRGAPLAIPARGRRVAYLDFGEKIAPRVVSHVIRTAAAAGATGAAPGEVTLDVTVDPAPPIVLGAPLAGGPWAAVYHSDWPRGHRRVFYTVDGVTRLPGRHTIDFVKLDDEGRTTRRDGNGDAIADSLGYGADVLAVSDATVAAVRGDMPEPDRAAAAVKHRQEDAAGNYISLDLGGGRFAVYEHLKPASIRVKPGQRVRRGDIIGQAGFTGDSTGPHLHLHVGDAASPLGAEGRAFVFDRFATLGRYTDISAMGKSRWQSEGSTLRYRERPGPNVIVDFGTIPGTWSYREPLRPRFHFSPATNFMNDPNGLVFYKGEYHLFYQHNPLGPTWGHMTWGHAVSKDLLHWEHLPLALSEENGIMIFSGSAVVDQRNTSGFCQTRDGDSSCLVAIYTGHEKNRQTQHLAYSNDRGRSWTKYVGNPVIDLGLKDFRDPKVFWHAPTARWIMVTVLSDQRKVRFFGSTDLKRWEALSDFGPAGATGGVWECPDLFPLEVEGEPGNIRWVLDVDINPGAVAGGSGGQYFVGTFDGRTFVNDNAPGHTMWADYGKDFYATISFSDIPPSDGRRIWMAWISNWAYANVEPTDLWRGAQSIPRQLALRRMPEGQGLRLVQKPIAELASLREKPETIAIEANSNTAATATPAPESFELQMDARRGSGTWQQAGIRLFNAAGEEVTIGINSQPLELFVNREKSRAGTTFHKDYAGRHSAPLRWRNDRVTLHVFFDRSVIEVFANDGETVITDRVYPSRPLDRMQLLPGAQAVTTTRLWPLRSTWPSH